MVNVSLKASVALKNVQRVEKSDMSPSQINPQSSSKQFERKKIIHCLVKGTERGGKSLIVHIRSH